MTGDVGIGGTGQA
jgi:choice-of-anchor A domain-containing protein